jgi:hypothetical protein
MEDKAKLAAAVRENGLIAIKLSQERFGLNIREAKALVFHVTRKWGMPSLSATFA